MVRRWQLLAALGVAGVVALWFMMPSSAPAPAPADASDPRVDARPDPATRSTLTEPQPDPSPAPAPRLRQDDLAPRIPAGGADLAALDTGLARDDATEALIADLVALKADLEDCEVDVPDDELRSLNETLLTGQVRFIEVSLLAHQVGNADVADLERVLDLATQQLERSGCDAPVR